MKIEQLRILCEVVDQGFSMSRAADALDISQPNVSKQICLLEEQISVDLLLRRGGRVIGMTEPGGEVLKVARRIVRDAGNLRSIGEDFRRGDRGRLTIATTHFIARYLLTDCVKRFHLAVSPGANHLARDDSAPCDRDAAIDRGRSRHSQRSAEGRCRRHRSARQPNQDRHEPGRQARSSAVAAKPGADATDDRALSVGSARPERYLAAGASSGPSRKRASTPMSS